MTDLGISIEVKLEQFEKSPSLIEVMESGNFTDLRKLQLEKTLVPRDVTVLDISIFSSLLMLAKAASSMVVTEAGMSMEDNPVPANMPSVIQVRPSGSFKEDRW